MKKANSNNIKAFYISGGFLYQNIDLAFQYLQIVPSYMHNFNYENISFLIEIGFSLNKIINRGDVFILIDNYNYDIRLSGGVKIQHSDFGFRINFLYSKALTKYEDSSNERGSFVPYQLGVEASISYYINGE